MLLLLLLLMMLMLMLLLLLLPMLMLMLWVFGWARRRQPRPRRCCSPTTRAPRVGSTRTRPCASCLSVGIPMGRLRIQQCQANGGVATLLETKELKKRSGACRSWRINQSFRARGSP
jgi:hypothetical protein